MEAKFGHIANTTRSMDLSFTPDGDARIAKLEACMTGCGKGFGTKRQRAWKFSNNGYGGVYAGIRSGR